MVTKGYQRLPKVTEDYQRLPKVNKGYIRLLKVTKRLELPRGGSVREAIPRKNLLMFGKVQMALTPPLYFWNPLSTLFSDKLKFLQTKEIKLPQNF